MPRQLNLFDELIIDNFAGGGGKPVTKSVQVARCGNAVCPPLAEALVRANLPELCGRKLETMAELEKEMAI